MKKSPRAGDRDDHEDDAHSNSDKPSAVRTMGRMIRASVNPVTYGACLGSSCTTQQQLIPLCKSCRDAGRPEPLSPSPARPRAAAGNLPELTWVANFSIAIRIPRRPVGRTWAYVCTSVQRHIYDGVYAQYVYTLRMHELLSGGIMQRYYSRGRRTMGPGRCRLQTCTTRAQQYLLIDKLAMANSVGTRSCTTLSCRETIMMAARPAYTRLRGPISLIK